MFEYILYYITTLKKTEWHNGQAGQLVLPIDQTTMLENNSRWRRLYTISDYKVNNEATLALKMKNQINLSSSVSLIFNMSQQFRMFSTIKHIYIYITVSYQ